jgi:hypothetical protein
MLFAVAEEDATVEPWDDGMLRAGKLLFPSGAAWPYIRASAFSDRDPG